MFLLIVVAFGIRERLYCWITMLLVDFLPSSETKSLGHDIKIWRTHNVILLFLFIHHYLLVVAFNLWDNSLFAHLLDAEGNEREKHKWNKNMHECFYSVPLPSVRWQPRHQRWHPYFVSNEFELSLDIIILALSL